MTLKNCFVLLMTAGCLSTASAQDLATYYLIGEDVNVRKDTLLNSKPLYQASFGAKFQGELISDNWFRYYDEYVMADYLYVHASLVAQREDFCNVAEERADKNAGGWLELLRCYFEQDDPRNFETTAYILNNYMHRDIFPGFEKCDLVGRLAYVEWLDRVDSTAILAQTELLLAEVQDSSAHVLPLLDQIEEQVAAEDWNIAEEKLLSIISNYAEHLYLPIACDHDAYRRVKPLLRTKDLLRSVFNANPVNQKDLLEKLSELQHASSEATQHVAEDLVQNIAGDTWDHSAYTKYKIWQ